MKPEHLPSAVIAMVLALRFLVSLTDQPGPRAEIAGEWPYVPREILIKFKDEATPAQRACAIDRFHAVRLHTFKSGAEHWRLGSNETVAGALAVLTDDPIVEYVQPSWLHQERVPAREEDRTRRLPNVPASPASKPTRASTTTPGRFPPLLQQMPFPPLIAARCPQFPALNADGVLCEGFDTDRNGQAGFQWSRLPVSVGPSDPLRAVGDSTDDVLGYTQGTGASPAGTGAVTCPMDVGFPDCQAPVAEENDWHLHSPNEGPGAGYDPRNTPGIGAPDGGKAHSGVRSMHMGRHTDRNPFYPDRDTLRFRQVSAFVIDSQEDPTLPGLALGPSSTLEFWHMIAWPDDENFGNGFIPEGTSFGGGQVQISLLGANGRFERWRRPRAVFNGYDSIDQGTATLCAFDPGDDQIPPDDLTMCQPASMWADIGDVHGTDPTCAVDTDGNDPLHKDCGDIKSCTGGPGCTETGSLGEGVWARSRFDLSPFAGRLARLRWIGMVEGGWTFGQDRSFLEPPSESGRSPTLDPHEWDDGWWIDDIVLTDIRTDALPCQEDSDLDGVQNCDDCHTSDGSAWETPGEVTGVVFSADAVTLTWSPPSVPGGTVVAYDVLRSPSPNGFVNGFVNTLGALTTCVETNGADTITSDPALPPLGKSFYYQVRAENACPVGAGSLGAASSGAFRRAPECP